MNACITLYTNNRYVDWLIVFLHSLYSYNPEYKELDVVLFHDGLSDINKRKLKKVFKTIKFKKVSMDKYNKIMVDTDKDFVYSWHKSTYYKLEVLNLKGYDKAILFDIDMLVVGKFDVDLIGTDANVMMCRDHGPHQGYYKRDYFNSGLVVIGKKYLNKKSYERALVIAAGKELSNSKGIVFPDQDAYNKLFEGDITPLHLKYNLMPYDIGAIKQDKIKIIHYAGNIKPWSFGMRRSNDFWNVLWRECEQDVKKKYKLK